MAYVMWKYQYDKYDNDKRKKYASLMQSKRVNGKVKKEHLGYLGDWSEEPNLKELYMFLTQEWNEDWIRTWEIREEDELYFGGGGRGTISNNKTRIRCGALVKKYPELDWNKILLTLLNRSGLKRCAKEYVVEHVEVPFKEVFDKFGVTDFIVVQALMFAKEIIEGTMPFQYAYEKDINEWKTKAKAFVVSKLIQKTYLPQWDEINKGSKKT